jgi:hypothetical protein
MAAVIPTASPAHRPHRSVVISPFHALAGSVVGEHYSPTDTRSFPMNWYERKRREREQTRRLTELGYVIKDEPPLFFTGGRGRAFGRRPVGTPTGSQTSPKVESADWEEKRD